MKTIDYLRKLSDDGNYEGVINVPFLLLAHERGIVGEEELARAAVLIEEQRAGYYQVSNDVIKSLHFEADVAPEHAEFRKKLYESRYDDGSEQNLYDNRLQAGEALNSLEKSFPGTASAYRRWYDEIGRMDEKAVNAPTRQYVAQHYRAFKETSLWEEMEIQALFERLLWNKVGISVLIATEGSDALWLKGASEFISEIDEIDTNHRHASGRFKFDAVTFQTAVLSAAIMWSLKQSSQAHYLLNLGEKTIVEVEGAGGFIAVDTPEYSHIDLAARLHEGKGPSGGLVTLPAGPMQFGAERWKKLMGSPLFTKSDARLIPSDAFWGLKFPALKPEKPSAFLARHFEKWSSDEQHLWAQVNDIKGTGSYGLTIVNQTKAKDVGYNANAALHLVITNGEIESARYEIYGLNKNKSLTVEVDGNRIRRLVARARAAGASPRGKKRGANPKTKPVEKKMIGGISQSEKIKEARRSTRAAESVPEQKKKSSEDGATGLAGTQLFPSIAGIINIVPAGHAVK